MADPREDTNHVGIGYNAESYGHDDTIVYDATKVGGSAQVGKAVSLESSDTVTLAGDGEGIEGKLIKVEPGGVAVVQNQGTCTLPGGSGASLTVGGKVVGDLGAGSAEGYIQVAAAGTAAHHVVSRGVIVDATDSENVVVRLE